MIRTIWTRIGVKKIPSSDFYAAHFVAICGLKNREDYDNSVRNRGRDHVLWQSERRGSRDSAVSSQRICASVDVSASTAMPRDVASREASADVRRGS